MKQKIDFRKLGTEDRLGRFDENENVFEIHSPHALTQVIGYIKFKYNNGPVLFRGQGKNYQTMKPSLLRDSNSLHSFFRRSEKLNKYIYQLIDDNAFMDSTTPIAYEPILQHYGIKTTWLDLVDNIWTALWFASYSAHATGPANKYMHYEISKNEFSYISILYFGKIENILHKNTKRRIKKLYEYKNIPTYKIEYPSYPFFETEKYTLIDLRYMTPSLYRRPHSQHAMLARRTAFLSDSDMDYNDSKICTLKIRTSSAIEWIGNGMLSKVHFMFPPPTYDPGYKLFLDKGIDPEDKELGSIQHIGA